MAAAICSSRRAGRTDSDTETREKDREENAGWKIERREEREGRERARWAGETYNGIILLTLPHLRKPAHRKLVPSNSSFDANHVVVSRPWAFPLSTFLSESPLMLRHALDTYAAVNGIALDRKLDTIAAAT